MHDSRVRDVVGLDVGGPRRGTGRATTLEAVPEGSPRWIVLTTFNVIVVLLGAFILVTERTLVGYMTLVVGGVAFAVIWRLRREATEQALRTILWAVIWCATGGGGPWNDRR